MMPMRTPSPVRPVLCHVSSARVNTSVPLFAGFLGMIR
ncbi:Uncharacterised protein [Mycobacteroides abscessus]|nr:Uncharacterised protein [Mycobacteroides abscessus]